ncbi:MAG: lmo0937 family membrane protein [Spirochaetes bacterium]|nr:lmo0937 family membrane protein [Spirochaetota bacterium]
MLLIIGVVLLILWLLGFVSAYTLGGFIHVALVIGLILVVVWLVMRFSRRR